MGEEEDDWREAVYYGSQVTEWWGGLLCAVVASALSYYVTSKYADFQQVVRLNAAAKTPEKRPVAVSVVSDTPTQRSRMSSVRVITLKTPAVLLFVVFLAGFVTLDFVALAILPLTLVVPTAMLIFVWGSIYQLRHAGRAYLRSRDWRRTAAILVLFAGAIGFGPKGLYVLHIPRVVSWNEKCVIYTAVFLAVAGVLHVLRVSPKLTHSLRRRTQLSTKDMNTIIRANLAGLLGGQNLVLLKLVAEIIEKAIFKDKGLVFESNAVFVVAGFAALTTVLHLYSYHYMLAVLEEANVRLLVPLHRFAFIVSASVGAAVYLEEWVDDETTWVNVVGYTICIVLMLVICVLSACDAVRINAVIARREGEIDAEAGDIEMAAADMAAAAAATSPNGGSSTGGLASPGQPTSPGPPRLWDLGAGSLDSYDPTDDEDGFFMSSSRTLTQGLRRKLPSPTFSRLAGLRAPCVKGGATSFAATAETGHLPPLDHQYPQARNTMMTHRSQPNPHTDGADESRWEDPGAEAGQWRVRGASYLQDKVKVQAGPTCMQVASMQWSYSPEPLSCVAHDRDGFVAAHQAGRSDRPFMFIINFMVPSLGNYVMYYVPRPGLDDEVFYRMLGEFVNAPDDAYRNSRFKLIPGVKEGGMFVRRAVGAKPALLCSKLSTTYYSSWDRERAGPLDVQSSRGQWFEVAIDVGSSRIARSIMGAVKGYASSLVLHMGYLIESKTAEELPERVLGGVDLYRPCMQPRAGTPLVLSASPQPQERQATGAFSGPDSPPERGAALELIEAGAVFDGGSDADLYASDDSDDSFHSVMDPGEVAAAGKNSRADAASPQSAAETAAVDLDYDYPLPEDTMVVPMGTPNPHADPGKSVWADAGRTAAGWKVRGPAYDEDRVKVPCGTARMRIVAMDWKYSPAEPIRNIASEEGGFVAKHHAGRADRPFLLVINFLVPSVGNYVTYLARNPDEEDAVFDEMLDAFINAEDDEYRNARLKLIPGVLEGSYFVRKAVGAKPALLCQKLTTRYFRGDNCFEVSIDVGSSIIGARIFSAVKGFASSLVLHLGVVLESKARRELPERLLFGIDIHCPVMAPRKSTQLAAT